RRAARPAVLSPRRSRSRGGARATTRGVATLAHGPRGPLAPTLTLRYTFTLPIGGGGAMRSLFLLLVAVVLFSDTALAAPGEPRTVKGTLEWPATLSAEPVAVIRGDDGAVYYVDASTAERRGSPITGRVSVIGVEGMKPQEVSAVVIGAGDSALGAL